MYRQPRFLYFDLGNVLLHFSHARMCQQVADALNAPVESVREFLFSAQIHLPYERGQITTTALVDELNRRFNGRLTLPEVNTALGDIFWLNTRIVPLLVGLKSAGYRLGVLSNTCDAHWQAARRQFAILDQMFEAHVLSFEVGATKPNTEIYQAAADQVGCDPGQLFFTDDLLENVEGARGAGVDAVVFTSVTSLAADLRRRHLHFRF